MGMVEMGSYETNTPRGAMGTDLHGMKTPWGAMAQWGWDPMRPRPHRACGHGGDGTQWGQDPTGRNADRSPWDEDPMGHMGMVWVGPNGMKTPKSTMGTDLHGMKTPVSIWE